MKGLILLFVFVAIATVESKPEWRMELLGPQGMRFLMKDITGLKSSAIGVEVLNGDEATEEFGGALTQRADGWWVYENTASLANPGNTISFLVANSVDGKTSATDILANTIREDYMVPLDAQRVPV